VAEAVHAARATRRRLPIMVGGRLTQARDRLRGLDAELVEPSLAAAVALADAMLARMLART
jgi:hypothetical protein